MNKTKFTLGKFSFPVLFLQPTVKTPDNILSYNDNCAGISRTKGK
jgi:hypothetical protein